jgi:hypothetical protein
MNHRLRWATLAVALTVATPAFAQSDPSPEALKLARDLVTRTEGDRAATLQNMSAPMVGMMQQMGVTQPDRAQALVNEALLPLLSDHYDDLLAIQSKSYASALSVDDMKAAIVFYDSPAGKDFIRAQPALAKSKLTGMTQWMGGLQPEMQSRIQATMKAHGWDKG